MAEMYISNPMVVTAIRWEGTNASEVVTFLGQCEYFNLDNDCEFWSIMTPDGVKVAHEGDWIIKSVGGAFCVAIDAVFHSGFTAVGDIISK